MTWWGVQNGRFFFMFPVLFRGTNSLVHPFTKFVYCMRLLLGRVISEKKRRDRGWQTSFNHVFRSDLTSAKRLLPESMSEYSKVNPKLFSTRAHAHTHTRVYTHPQVTPPSCGKSHMHQTVHYTDFVGRFGSLSGGWMFTDERRNKVNPNPFSLC